MNFFNVKLQAGMALASLTILSGCGSFRRHSELECMERVMYFESNRSSRDGMVAVGTVVMNRATSGEYPRSVCGVVSQKGQFAPGVMSRKMNTKSAPLIKEAAISVMRGERHPMVRQAKFFHTAGYRAGYNNMHYVLVTGGNAFYERRRPEDVTQPVPPQVVEGITGRR